MDRRRDFPVFSSWPQLLCLLVTCTMAVLAALALVYLDEEPSSVSSLPALASAQEEQSASAVITPTYLMKSYGGKLAVFQQEQETPLLIFDVYVSTLPEYDQRLLQKGIPAKGEEHLTRLIEDYIS